MPDARTINGRTVVTCAHCGGSFLARDLDTMRANGWHTVATQPEPRCIVCGRPVASCTVAGLHGMLRDRAQAVR